MKLFRKLTAAMLSVMMIAATLATPLYAAENRQLKFKDVLETDWYYDSVKYAYDNGIVDGVAEDRFAPGLPLTRAMAVTMLYRIAGKPDITKPPVLSNLAEFTGKCLFRDLAANSWYENAAVWAAQRRIVNGRTPTEFVPMSNMTRAEFAAMLTRYTAYNYLSLPSAGEEKKFADEAAIPSYARLSVSYLANAKVIDGKGNNTFDPNAPITRAEAVAMLKRLNDTAIDLQKKMSAQYGFKIEEFLIDTNRMPSCTIEDRYVGIVIIFTDPSDKPMPVITGSAKVYYNGGKSQLFDTDSRLPAIPLAPEPEYPNYIDGFVIDPYDFQNGDSMEVYLTLTIADHTYTIVLCPIASVSI